MPRYKPIKFLPSPELESVGGKIETFIAEHPVAASAAKAVLALAAVGGALTILAIAPGLARLTGSSRKIILQKEREKEREKEERYRRLWKSFYYMKEKGVFEYDGEDKDGYQIYRLTEKGVNDVRKFTLETLEIKSAPKWDGKWRLVIFDIPEKYRKARGALSGKLREMNFYPLQKSAWVYPFPCEAEITFIKDVFNIHPFIEVLTVENLRNGKALHHFQAILKDSF